MLSSFFKSAKFFRLLLVRMS